MKLRILMTIGVLAAFCGAAADKKIVLLAGGASHGKGDHEHLAGCLLFQSCLDKIPGVTSSVHSNGWPADPKTAFENAATILIYSDGGGGHPFLQGDRLQVIGDAMKRGVGLVCVHYAVEPTPGTVPQFLDWLGGAFEVHWSVNPFWTAEFQELPDHVITRGVKPFKATDEWYFHMRFKPGMQGVTPILSAVPPQSTTSRADGPHSGNPTVREAVKRGDPQHLAWAYERSDGGRGFGFTGGHSHKNWANENVRKLVLNGILWTAKVEIPTGGVACLPTEHEMRAGLK